MNQPPDWADLARNIAEHDQHDSTMRALIVTNTRMVITDIIIPAFQRAVPKATLHPLKQEVIFPYGSSVRFRAVTRWTDVENLRGMEFDLIFFDPVWQGDATYREAIITSCKVRHASR